MTGIPTGPAQAAADPFTATQRYYWRIALELRLRKANSDAFQDFFSTVMGLLHGDDFVRVRPYGALGDKGCDGYLHSVGQLFQCYGALAGELKQHWLQPQFPPSRFVRRPPLAPTAPVRARQHGRASYKPKQNRSLKEQA